MKSGNVNTNKTMPYHNRNRKPPSFNGPDGEYFDTVDKYTPSKPVPGFYEGNDSGRYTDPSASWGGGYDSGGGGSAMFMG